MLHEFYIEINSTGVNKFIELIKMKNISNTIIDEYSFEGEKFTILKIYCIIFPNDITFIENMISIFEECTDYEPTFTQHIE